MKKPFLMAGVVALIACAAAFASRADRQATSEQRVSGNRESLLRGGKYVAHDEPVATMHLKGAETTRQILPMATGERADLATSKPHHALHRRHMRHHRARRDAGRA